jgi:hypothetical protein
MAWFTKAMVLILTLLSCCGWVGPMAAVAADPKDLGGWDRGGAVR